MLIITALYIAAIPVAAMGQPVATFPGIERATTRADTMRNAITIHDEVSASVCAPTAETTSSLTRDQFCLERGHGPNSLMHFYWTWLIRTFLCVGAVLVAGVAFTSHRNSKAFLPLAVVVAVLALLDAGNLVLGGWSTARSAQARLDRAEWQWRLDLAKASSLPGEAGGRSALDAAQRYAAAASPR